MTASSPRRRRTVPRRRVLGVGAAFAVAAAAGLRCGRDAARPPERAADPPEPRRGGVFRSLLDEEPATLDPITPSGGVGNQIAAFAYSRLVRFRVGRGARADGTLEGDLAEAWEQPDAATLVLRLRAAARFDPRPPTVGRAVDATDIVASWEAFAARGTYRTDLATAADKDAPILALRAAGDRVVALTLAGPDAQMLPTLASRFGLWVLPREAFAGGYDPALEARGSGPWLLERVQPSVGFSFRANPTWYAAPE